MLLSIHHRGTETQRRGFRSSIASDWKFKSKIANLKSKIFSLCLCVSVVN